MALAECPKCGGTGWKVVERPGLRDEAKVVAVADDRPGAAAGEPSVGWRFAVRCDCAAADRMVRALEQARVPKRYEHCDFENFEIDLYEQEPDAAAWNRSLKQAKLVVEAFTRDYPVSTEHGLLLMGPCGVGKTHLAVAALKATVLRGHSGLFYDYRELLKQIQASYNPESQSTEMEVLEPVLKAELLLLDDLGASKPSLWALETVGHILNVRYNEKRVTLMTTNYLDAPEIPAESAWAGPRALTRDDTLADRVGQRIRSRLYEMCRTVEIGAPDYRKIRRAWHLQP